METKILMVGPEEITNNHLYAVQSHAYLLECVMATYESLLFKKSSSKSEIRRHENMIRNSFMAMASDFLRIKNLPTFRAEWRHNIRLDTVVVYMTLEGGRDTAEMAIARYFLNLQK